MNRIPILAGGAVLAAVVLCGGGVAVANAVIPASQSQILTIGGVSTSPTATSNATTAASTATTAPSDDPTTAAPSAESPAPQPSPSSSGVTVVKPSDPTKLDGKNCGHMSRGGADDPADHDANDDHGTDGHSWTPTDHGTGTPTPEPSATSDDSTSWSHGGWNGGSGSGSRHHHGGWGSHN